MWNFLFFFLITSVLGMRGDHLVNGQTIKLVNNNLEIYQEFEPSLIHMYDYVVSHELRSLNDSTILYKTEGIAVYYKDVSTKKHRLYQQISRLIHVNETITQEGKTIRSQDTLYDRDFDPYGFEEDYIIVRNRTAGFASNTYPWSSLAFATGGLVIYPSYSVQFGEPWSYNISFEDAKYNITMGFHNKNEVEGYVALSSNNDNEILNIQGTFYLTIASIEGTAITYHGNFRGTSKTEEDTICWDHKFVSTLVCTERPIPSNIKDEL